MMPKILGKKFISNKSGFTHPGVESINGLSLELSHKHQSKVDDIFGIGLYMSPSNMQLKLGQVVGYNNIIVVATDKQTLGFNSDLNTVFIMQPNTGKTGIVKSQSSTVIKSKTEVQQPHVEFIVGGVTGFG